MPTNILLKATNIYKTYKLNLQTETSVLKGISLDIYSGEFLAIMGPSGVGKSTLLHLLGSIDKPDSGSIELNVDSQIYDYSKLSDDILSNIRNKYIGFVFQFHHLLPEFSAIENVMMPALIAGKSFAKASEKARELMEIVNIDHRIRHKPSELSGGEQQRIALARALINEPILVLADEPTGNLDSKNAASVLELIQNIREKFSVTFISATHSPYVSAIAEKILYMGDGKIKA
ncbi:MAG: ABC transporter ATP-binding protein [FCB group bacterium]